MSIITPTDTITITIDNTKSPAPASMRLSRDLPAPYVALILSQLIAQTMTDVMVRMGSVPVAQPQAQPATQPPNVS